MTNETKSGKFSFEGVAKWLTVFFLLLFAYKLFRLFFIHDKLNDYLLSENLLHYENGYIRRSLLGNLFIALPEAYWKPAIIALYSLMMTALLAFMYRSSKSVYVLLLFICAPFGFRMVLFDFGSMYRKEFMFFLLIVLLIILYRYYKNHTVILVLSAVLSSMMIMVHESFIFLAMPVLAWILYINKAGISRVAIYVLICGISFVLLSRSPSAEQIGLLDAFFSRRNIDWSKTREFMVLSKTDTLKMSLSHLMQGSILFYLIFFLPILAYLAYSRLIWNEMRSLLVIQLLCVTIICIVAIDYGRWLSFVLVSYLICLFSYHNLEDFSERIRSSAREKIIFIALLIFMLSVHLPHYILNYDFSKNIVEYSFIEKISYSLSELVKENQ